MTTPRLAQPRTIALLAACSLAASAAIASGPATTTTTLLASTHATLQQPAPTADDPYAVVEQAAKAFNKLKSLTAQVEVGAKGELSQMLPAAKARLRALRPAVGGNELKPAPLMVRITGEGKRASTQPMTKVDVVFKDGKFYWLDTDAKVLRERFPRVARDRQVQIARDFLSKDLFEGEPYARLLKQEGMTMDQPATVDGVLCDVVQLDLGGGTRTERFYFGADDHLPRKIETSFAARGIKGSMFTVFTKLKPNATLTPQAFELDLPEGFTRESDTRISRPDMAQPRPDRPTPADRRDATTTPLRMATDFTLKHPDGSPLALHDLRGKVVVLDFWGTWLPGSLRAGPDLQKLQDDYADKGVRVLGLNFRERDPQRAIDRMKDNNLTYDLLLDADKVVRDYRVVQFPTFIIIGAKGEIIKEVSGYQPEATFKDIRNTIDLYLEQQRGAQPTEPAQPTRKGPAIPSRKKDK